MIEKLKEVINALDLPYGKGDDWHPITTQELREIINQLEQVEVLREALMYYAKEHKNPSDGPWGRDSYDYGDVARAALSQAKGDV